MYDDFTDSEEGQQLILKSKQIRCTFQNTGSKFVFAGYVKPGIHTVVVFDPKSNKFYQRNIYVTPRASEIEIAPKLLPAVKSLRPRVPEAFSQSIVDQDKFVFKYWTFLTPTHLSQMFLADFSFCTNPEILNLLRPLYPLLLQTYRSFLPNQSFSLIEEFLE